MSFRRRLTIIISIDLGIILILSVGLWFVSKDIANRGNSISKTRNEINSWTQSIQSLASLHQDADKARVYMPQLDAIFPNRDALINFSRDLNELGLKQKIVISAKLGNEERSADQIFVNFNFLATAQGPLDNLVNLLKDLKNSRYFIGIKNLDITRQTESTARDFNMTINGQIYTYDK